MADMQAFGSMIRTWKDMLALTEEDTAFLCAQTDPVRAVRFFECAICGITVSEMKEMDAHGLDEEGIREKRKEILMERFRAHDQLVSEIGALKKQTKEKLSELEEVRKYYEEQLAVSWDKERVAMQDALSAREEALKTCREHIKELQASLKEERKIREAKRNPRLWSRPRQKDPDRNAEKVRREEKEFEELQFRDGILRNPAYTKEQKEYLLACFNEGLSYWALAKVAHPDLPVEFMKALMERRKKEAL